jgi:hypothetical protein
MLSLKHLSRCDTLNAVNWLQRIVAMVLLAAWMPAASLCLAECAGLVERGDCCPHESDGNPDVAGAACCLLASGSYKSDTQRPAVPVLLACALPPALPDPVCSLAPSWRPSPEASPPELPVTWQFSFRTALAPRAPSSAS